MTDHLPLVRGVTQLRIPYFSSSLRYGDQPRGFEGFRKFPMQYGWNIERLVCAEAEDLKYLELLQSWLFFGLLVEAFGGPPMGLKSDDLVDQAGDGIQYVTTRNIQKYFWYWRAWRIHVKTEKERAVVENHAKQLDMAFDLANRVFQKVVAKEDGPRFLDGTAWSQHQAVLLSIALIAEWVYEARRVAADIQESYVNSIKPLQWRLPRIETALCHAGWCAGEIVSLLNECDTTCLYYLSMIDRNITRKIHTNCSTEEGCKALVTDYNTYKPIHLGHKEETSECRLIGPSIRDVAAVLEKGNIPLVVQSGVGSYTLQECNTEAPIVYVAISHVWSDGLGNPRQNKLNACTFHHIQRLVNDLYNATNFQVPFWIDTMCIPPQENHNPKQKDMRLRGIKLMAQTYKIADKVLVLDSTLKQQSSLIEAAEMKVRIRKGPWATRLWTLQEGRLGRSLYFQVCDTAMSSSYLEDVIGDEKNMKEAMSYLKPLSLEEIAANRCAKLVLRAFATSMELNPLVNTYALLPPQDDPDKEEFRQIAVSIMKQWAEMSELRQAWRPMIEKLDLQSKLRDDDEHLATAIRVSRIDLVDNYGMNMMRRIRGYGFASIEGSRNVLVQGTDQSAGILMDVCAGIRGRTTSRLEDETVCLGILLQIPNLDAVLEIKPLHWGWKQIMAAIGRGRIMSKCHENRMKALLSQIRQNSSTTYQETSVQKYEGANALPQSLIFWNVPRLGYRGWAWAPLSFLAPRPNQDIQAERNGRLTQQGLEVDFPGFIFQGFSHLSSPQACTRDAILVINLNALSPSQSSPFRQTWQRLRLRRDDQTRPHKRASPLISWLYTGELMKMAILIKQERIDDAAILVQIYDTRYGARLTRHVALLERVADNASLEEGVCELHVTAQWVENELWRVG